MTEGSEADHGVPSPAALGDGATMTDPGPGGRLEDSAEDGLGDDTSGSPTQSGGRRLVVKRSPRQQLVSWLVVLVLAAGCAIGLRAFVVQTFFVPSGSMEPTLQVGDRMLVQKIGFTIQRGDILVFRRPPGDLADTNNEDLVKRVIGLPGETISSRGNTVYINGKPLSEPYLPPGTILGKPIPTQKIPSGDYFMLGDNRNDSADSRYWGYLPRSYVVGKVILVVWRHGHPVFHAF
ncbi:MAG: signal peptidase I [Acidimicrobiales bacterium]